MPSARRPSRRPGPEASAPPAPPTLSGRGPVPLGDVLSDLFVSRGYSRFQAVAELEHAWESAIGEPGCRQTKVSGLRRGVLNVVVTHPVLLQELAAFRKPQLLAALRQAIPETPIQDIRFRVGSVEGGETSRSDD